MFSCSVLFKGFYGGHSDEFVAEWRARENSDTATAPHDPYDRRRQTLQVDPARQAKGRARLPCVAGKNEVSNDVECRGASVTKPDDLFNHRPNVLTLDIERELVPPIGPHLIEKVDGVAVIFERWKRRTKFDNLVAEFYCRL
ncbi:hypothetical protein ASD82_11325 [Rhodanobacter sp. Root179]|nr:hypothetical protein ASD82_11325 [Rhodanobacter sp. Root179]